MIGNDGSRHAYIVQNPSAKQARREERVLQLLRVAESIVDKKIISRRNNVSFNVQSIVPLSAFVRMIQDDVSFVSFEDVYTKYCRQAQIQPEDPVFYFRDAMTKGIESLSIAFKKGVRFLLFLER